MSYESHVLITGATGLIGRKWLAALLAINPCRQVTVLARRPESLRDIACGRICVLPADLTVPGLGLSENSCRTLKHTVTEIIHCAADIRFGLPLSHARAVNTCGAARLVDLGRSCGGLRKFSHLSTLYIAGKSPGVVPEKQYRNTSGFFNTYQQSKYEAEELVSMAMGHIPAAIYRLSSIIGDSSTGAVNQFNYFHQLLNLVPRNILPIIPGIPDAPVDLIAADWAVDALSALFESHFTAGRYYNVCAGPSNSLTVQEVVETTFDQVRSHRRHSSGPVMRVPKLVSLEEFERFSRSNLNTDQRVQKILRAVSHFLPHLAVWQHFDNGSTLALLRSSGVELPPIRGYYPKIVQYCLDSQ